MEKDTPPIDFNTLILSLSTSALAASPSATEEPSMVELALIKQTIDILTLIEEKTKGNLTGEEEHLLSQVLIDLRVRYIQQSKGRIKS